MPGISCQLCCLRSTGRVLRRLCEPRVYFMQRGTHGRSVMQLRLDWRRWATARKLCDIVHVCCSRIRSRPRYCRLYARRWPELPSSRKPMFLRQSTPSRTGTIIILSIGTTQEKSSSMSIDLLPQGRERSSPGRLTTEFRGRSTRPLKRTRV